MNSLAPNLWVSVAQLVEYCRATCNIEAMVLNPVEAPIFFQA